MGATVAPHWSILRVNRILTHTNLTEAGTSILVDLLSEDRLVVSCCQDALHNDRFQPERVQSKLRHVLKRSAKHMSSDQALDPYDRQILAPFVRRFARNASYQLCTVLAGDDGAATLRLDALPDRRDYREKVEDYVSRIRERLGSNGDSTRGPLDDDRDSESDSEDEDDDSLDIEFPNLSHLRRVLMTCESAQIQRREFFSFVYPELHQRLKKLAAKITNPIHPDVSTRGQYDWARFIAELRCADPQSMVFGPQETRGWVNRCQGAVETWSGMKWDWWPLKPYMRVLAGSTDEARVS
ncbi:hypothetical protein BDW74DRAFT_171393 [Aspergillus multicolor]|uniref:uncharacterized protein n=1 Tax=Aspergillus multicolor TaxID=41759 RepID=UPI003CCD0A3B